MSNFAFDKAGDYIHYCSTNMFCDDGLLLIYCLGLPEQHKTVELVRMRVSNIKKSVLGKQRAAANVWWVPGDSAKNWLKSSELKTHCCQSPGDINYVLAPLWPFIIARLAITGSLPPANKKNPEHLRSPRFGICRHNYCGVVLKVKANIINRAARHEKPWQSCPTDAELSGSS